MRSVFITLGSFALTAGVIANAYLHKRQFYPSVVYITKSSPSMAVLYIQALVLVVLLGKIMRQIFFSQLRSAELEHLIERSWYAVTETCLAFTVFRDDFSPRFVALFTILLFLKCFHWLAEDRIDYMERSPVITWLFHLRAISLLCLLGALDAFFVNHAYSNTLYKGPSVQLVFGFEYAILLTVVVHVFVKYVLHTVDLQSENPWENKAVFLLYAELALGFIKCVLYLVFLAIMIKVHTFPLFVIRPMYLTIREFKKALNDVVMSRRAIRNMNTLYPDATEEDLTSGDNVCIICREEMHTACKKLPCNHIFHTSCLRSWFQRQQTCPTCRMDVLRHSGAAAGQAAAAARQAAAAAAAAAPQQAAQQAAWPPAGAPVFPGWPGWQAGAVPGWQPAGPVPGWQPQPPTIPGAAAAAAQAAMPNGVPGAAGAGIGAPQMGFPGWGGPFPAHVAPPTIPTPGTSAAPPAPGIPSTSGVPFNPLAGFPNPLAGYPTFNQFSMMPMMMNQPFGSSPFAFAGGTSFPTPPLHVPNLAGLSDEELTRMEGSERRSVEARVQCLQDINVLLSAALIQMQQYTLLTGGNNTGSTQSTASAATGGGGMSMGFRAGPSGESSLGTTASSKRNGTVFGTNSGPISSVIFTETPQGATGGAAVNTDSSAALGNNKPAEHHSTFSLSNSSGGFAADRSASTSSPSQSQDLRNNDTAVVDEMPEGAVGGFDDTERLSPTNEGETSDGLRHRKSDH